MMLKNRFFLIVIMFFGLLSLSVKSQTLEQADSLLLLKEYDNAYSAYKELSLNQPRNREYALKYGELAYVLKKYDEAIQVLKPLVRKNKRSNLLLGNIYRENYLFEQAIERYNRFLTLSDTTDLDFELANRSIKGAKLGQNLLRRVENVEFVDSVVVHKKDFLNHIVLSPEVGQFIPKNDSLLSFKTQRGDKTYSSVLSDNHTDLSLSEVLLDGTTETKKIDDINTSFNENFPFLLLDGITLYYASDNEKSLGGYDIFITRLNRSENKFLKSENIGMPFNSPFNDYLMAIDEIKNVGLLVSDRYQPAEKAAIYRFIPNQEKIIVKTENLDSLVRKAQISTFNTDLQGSINKTNQKLNSQTISAQIYIKDHLFYSKAHDFKSDIAREYYFKQKKLNHNIEVIENELKESRNAFRLSNEEVKRRNLGEKILHLEKILLKQSTELRVVQKKMRNSEITYLENLQNRNK